MSNDKVREEVASILANNGKDRVRAAIVQKLADEEVAKRTELVLTAMNALSRLRADLKKFKPDQKGFDVDGKLISEMYSEAKTQERKKLGEKIEKLEKSINLALENDDYSKLKEQSSEKPDVGN